ncbi:MAG: hypothetical protein KIB00_16910 [Paeniclostridium sordellii]|nr:hypothetical protein [Paeniclostridium sordellii]
MNYKEPLNKDAIKYILMNKEIDKVYISNKPYDVFVVFKITDDLVLAIEIDEGTYKYRSVWFNKSDGTLNSISSSGWFTLPGKYDDFTIYIDKYKDENSEVMCDVRMKTGEVSKAMGYDEWDTTIQRNLDYNSLSLGFGFYNKYSSSLNQSYRGVKVGFPTNSNSQLIDPTLSTKSVSKYIGGQEYRLLTEDMVVDPNKVDTSKAIVVDEDAPRVLTEECLSVGYTTNTKDHQIHPKVNPVIEIDTTCEGCEKMG